MTIQQLNQPTLLTIMDIYTQSTLYRRFQHETINEIELTRRLVTVTRIIKFEFPYSRYLRLRGNQATNYQKLHITLEMPNSEHSMKIRKETT